ncbi:MAG: YhfC family intramembrane metalloprotease [Oscillospiraceae bacterium]|nr:YhfC family intramembrane metalloprotease [Oscillospiraceae bacterium]
MEQQINIGIFTVIGLGLASVTSALLPVILWIIWRKKAHAAWIPLIAGVVGYLFIGTFRGAARALFLTPLQDTPWLFYILQAVFAGVFEEGGRYLIFRYGIPQHDRYTDAASYGIGHGGLEHLIVGWQSSLFFGFVVALLYHFQGIDGLLAQGMDMEGLPELLQDIADHHFLRCLLIALVNFGSLLFQCCMSVLVFTAVQRDRHPRWLLAACGLHVLADIIPAFHFAGDLSEMEIDVLQLLFAAGAVYLTYRVRQHYEAENHTGELPDFT